MAGRRRGRFHPGGAATVRLGAAAGALALAAAACWGEAPAPDRVPLTLAATTTLEDSGLLAVLVDAFARDHPEIRLRVITAGTGEALEFARRGDADVTLTHAPVAESAFVAAGHGRERREVMHNEFVISGPSSDPAGIAGLTDAADALARIAAAGARFVSRGDESGTHLREGALWRDAGLEPAGDWFLEAGVGMGDAYRVASQRRAYILGDRATLLMLGNELDLTPHVAGDPRLRNQYAVTLAAGTERPEAARTLADWLLSTGVQELIGAYGRDRFGRPLFHPDAVP